MGNASAWEVFPYVRGFVVLRGNKGEALTNDGSGEVAFDAGRRDCFFITENAARAAIALTAAQVAGMDSTMGVLS